MGTWLGARKATALGAPLVALLLVAGVALAADTVVDLDNGPQTSNCGGGQVTWHFVLNQTDDGTTLIDFEAVFNTGTVTTFTFTQNPAVIHIFVATPGDATLTNAFATISEQDDPTKPRLVLSDFRCAPFATKEGHKFHDLNANSVWDIGEPGLAGWTIQAWQGATLVATTTTDATGYYKFTLSPGSYSVKEVCPAGAGWRQSFPTPITSVANCGANDYDITLVAGQTDSGNDFGNFQNATKSGSKFHDLNANSIWDAGEPGLAGWTIEAWQGATLVASTTTAANGSYSFSLTPGSYTIKEVCPAGGGWRQSFPAPITSVANCGANVYNITLSSGQTDSGNDFGNFQNATKSGSKFHDLNANSVRDAGEPGLAGWTIEAWQGATLVATTTTNASGAYSFSLTPGSYTIKEVCPAGGGWRQSFPTPITSVANCGANVYNITLGSGDTDSGNDFGNFQNATKSGTKFHDINENGAWDALEPALAGWEIHLFGTGADGSIHLVTTTNASGLYSFSVAPGTYTVCEILKVDWHQTYPNAGTIGAADCTGHTHGGTVTPGPWGWAITLTSGQQDTNNHFGNKFRFEGCTPGYWKVPQHHDSWAATGFTTGQTLESVFDVPNNYGLDNFTLVQALDFNGGSGLAGAARILLRAGVAALLNSAHPDVDYQYTTAQVISMVNTALASQSRSTMLTLASQLDTANNAGCPLN